MIGNLIFIPNEHLLEGNNTRIYLSKSENIALQLLSTNKDNVVFREELVAQIWDEKDPKIKEHSLNNVIYALRTKLLADTTISLVTIPKEGYKLSF